MPRLSPVGALGWVSFFFPNTAVIQRVYEQVAGILDEAYVATDDERIESAVKAFGGKVVMTSVHHKSGTDRCYEAYTKV